ncbi:MAG: tRNA (adenosine(37)-N6)-methyltransferase TrmM, partial [Bacteroidota bacterium]
MAAIQAQQNVHHSPWSDRITIESGDFLNYTPSSPFDYLISNPPYFFHSLPSPDQKRNLARHQTRLDRLALAGRAALLSDPHASLGLILPFETKYPLLPGWHLHKVCQIRSYNQNPWKRVLLEYQKQPQSDCITTDKLTIYEEKKYSSAFTSLTRDFYLNF